MKRKAWDSGETENPRATMKRKAWYSGSGVDVYFRCSVDGNQRFYHIELLEEEPFGEKSDPNFAIPLLPAAIDNPGVTGILGTWTACGKNIYFSGGLSLQYILLPHLFKHNIGKHDPEEWIIQQRSGKIRPYPLRGSFAAADVVNQKLYFMGGFYWPIYRDVDGPRGRPGERCGECFDLSTRTWSTLNQTPIKEIAGYCTRSQVTAKVRERADEPMEIVYYDMAAGSILFLDVTAGGKSHHVDADVLKNFALLRGPLKQLLKHPPHGLAGIDRADLEGLTRTVRNTRAVVIGQTFYWFNFDLRLYAFDIEAETWLVSSSLSLPPPCLKCPYGSFPRHPLLLGLPNGKMVVIFLTSPGELTVASLRFCKSTPDLLVYLEASQLYRIDDPNHSFMILGGQAHLKIGDGEMHSTFPGRCSSTNLELETMKENMARNVKKLAKQAKMLQKLAAFYERSTGKSLDSSDDENEDNDKKRMCSYSLFESELSE